MRWLSFLALVAAASAQIPSLGWCPDLQPMANFNMNRFLGTWYEAERYFTVSELGSRCVTTNYESTPEGRILVSNEITNSLTGLKRIMDGSLQLIGREGEGRVMIKYVSYPLPYDAEYSILDTDYDNYAVVWSCSGIGPVHTQNAWVLTRARIAPTNVMQAAYGVLDKYKISRAFFVKTNQADCNILPSPVESPESKSAVVVDDVVAKNAAVLPDVVVPEKVAEVVAEPVAKVAVKSNLPQERLAAPVAELAAEPVKPMQVPELILSEASEKIEKIEKPDEEPLKMDMKPEIPKELAMEAEKMEEKPAQ
ncbi:hypothetical protein JYU34_003607 [Plutella xylostella]|uniref:Lipocalin/cytosolic fatty-acid binding domain-containing protein n=1 Tax=Plutella xylostella TaxID=51655 RepID=A0ABQ7R0G2_PLUXY|nr:hypothetical protein JYU34_003607 [Plutella xylostella]